MDSPILSTMQKGSEGKSKSGGGRHSLLIEYVDKKVNVITNDGRNVIGLMRGFDQVCNIILEKCSERVFTRDTGVQVIPLGLQVIRGDNVAVVGEVDVEKDQKIAWENVKVCALFLWLAAFNFQYSSIVSVPINCGLTSDDVCFETTNRELHSTQLCINTTSNSERITYTYRPT